ncbi:MAG: hypothetical protein K2N01_02055 [Lachnospiraceae bacterium]|nr:hypothetical protein [Lachnospiraceae bacterium]
MIKALILGAFYLMIYYLVGFAAVKISKGNEKKDSVMLMGVFTYAVFFWMIGFPMKLLKIKVSTIGTVWLVVLGLGVALILWKWHRAMLDDLKYRLSDLWEHKWTSMGIAAVILFELVWVELQSVPGSPMDVSYYIGEISSAVFDNMAGVSDPYSGAQLSHFSATYVMETYLLHSSVVCRLFHIAPLIEVRTVMAAVAVILFNIILFQIGRCLFKDCRWKILLLLSGAFVICLFSNSIYVPGDFLLMRAFEGKNFLANIFIPVIFLYFLQLLEKERRSVWAGLFLAVCASFTYSMSAIFLLPVMLLGIFVPLVINKRSWKTALKAVGCMIPCGAAMAFYLCASRGYILLRI